MSKIPLNERTVTVRMKRLDLCDLMLACLALSQDSDTKRWEELHNKLKAIIKNFDRREKLNDKIKAIIKNFDHNQ